jgi:hypothetical protein
MKEQKKRNAFPADHADLMQRRSTAESIINKKTAEAPSVQIQVHPKSTKIN